MDLVTHLVTAICWYFRSIFCHYNYQHHIILININFVIVTIIVAVAYVIITHRPLVKWFLRQTTRLCELQRICYGETSGAPRTIAVGGWSIYICNNGGKSSYNFIVTVTDLNWDDIDDGAGDCDCLINFHLTNE